MKLTLAHTPVQLEKLLEKLEAAEEIGLDTESAGPLLRNRKWKNGRTFINVYRSTMIGFSIGFPAPEKKPRAKKEPESHGWYVPLFHNKKNAPFGLAQQVLEAVCRVPAVWSHNVKHDSKTLRLAGFPLPPNWYDSFLAAWLVRGNPDGNGLKELADRILGRQSPEFDPRLYTMTGKEALEYVCHDAVNTVELGQYYRPKLEARKAWDHFTLVESPFAIVLGEMEHYGMGLDFGGLRLVSADCGRVMAEAEERWEELFPGISITSSTQLQELFKNKVWTPCGTTAGGAYSTDQDAIKAQLSYHEPGTPGHEAAQLRLEHQQASKVATTYTLGFIEEAEQFPDRRLHPDYNHLGARTGRLSSSNPNATNVPVRSPQGRQVKASFVPGPGKVYVTTDYSQIELRVLAHFAGGKLAKAYKDNADVHQQTADIIGISRDKAKTVNFALQYGCSKFRLATILGITPDEAAPLREKLLAEYPELDLLKQKLVELADSRGARPYVKTILGRRVDIPQLLSVDPKERAAGERKAVNAVIQGSAADIVKKAMVDVRNRFLESGDWGERLYFVNQLHDAMTLEVDDDPTYIELVKEVVQETMEAAVTLRVPLSAEPLVGHNWLEAEGKAA